MSVNDKESLYAYCGIWVQDQVLDLKKWQTKIQETAIGMQYADGRFA